MLRNIAQSAYLMSEVLINRINNHVFTKEYINKNQYGFMPQRSMTDAALAVKKYVQEGFRSGEVTVLVSLDVEGAFNSAWWPSILKGLRDCGCPRNSQNLTKRYLSKRLAILQTNNTRIEAEITKGCPQGSCAGPGLWNIQYNSLLNMGYTNRTKTFAFADDLIFLTRGRTVREAENITNIEMTKISTWATNNEIQFNNLKSKEMLLPRRKCKERKELDIFFNNRPITQVHNVKYLGIILDSKLSFKDHINYMTEKCP